VRQYDAVESVPHRRGLNEIPCDANNPVRRPTGSAVTCAKLDLALERGMKAVSQASPSVQIEYKNWAPAVSYLHDLLREAELQCNADDIPAERRASLGVFLTALEEVYEFMAGQLDLLKLKGERLRNPELVEAVAQSVHGPADLPLSSQAVKAAYGQVSHLALMASLKLAAKTQSKPGAPKDAAQEDH
jgi:hypothetical protein